MTSGDEQAPIVLFPQEDIPELSWGNLHYVNSAGIANNNVQ